jgi:Bifunctional DNA primase/polymerase, N-terminal
MSILPDFQVTCKEHPSLDLLIVALEYASRRWSIMPTISKVSAHHWKEFQARQADEPMLRRMFARKDITGLAVILGSASGGLACRDFDDAGAYHQWAADHPELAALLPTVETNRGYHVYFLGPEGFQKLRDGEYRATSGQYCLLPPSRHPSGMHYTWRVPLPSGNLPVIDPVGAGFLAQDRPIAQDTQPPNHPTHNTHLCEQGKVPTEILETMPTAFGQRRNCLFEFSRRLKSIMPDGTARELKPIVRAWYEKALPVIRTKEWAESWEDFVSAWHRVRVPAGATWEEVTRKAAMINVDTGEHIGASASIIRLCAALQQHHGLGHAWPLSCRKAAEYAGVTHERAARILKTLVFENVLEVANAAGPRGSKKATEYRFHGVQR